MPTIIFTTPDGKEHNVTVDEGVTLMEAGRDANLGIEGTWRLPVLCHLSRDCRSRLVRQDRRAKRG